MEELQGLMTLFSHQVRVTLPQEIQPGPSTPHWNDAGDLVDNLGKPLEYSLPIAADNLVKDYSSGVNSGKRSIYRQ